MPAYPHAGVRPGPIPPLTMPDDPTKNPTVMPLGDHLEELRRRLFLAMLGVVPILALGLYFGKDILDILVRPLAKELKIEEPAALLQVTSVFEGFNTWVKVGLIVTLVFGAPWILYQLWRFIAPGLYLRERRFAVVLAPLSVLLTLAGMAFLYFVVLHFALNFFVHFNRTLLSRPAAMTAPLPPDISLPTMPVLKADPPDPTPGQMWVNGETRQLRVAIAMQEGKPPQVWNLPLLGDSMIAQHYKISEYLSMILTFALAFALAFQTPVVVLLLGWAGIVKPEFLRKHRKHAFLTCTIVGALMAPPDILSMLALMFPLYILYEFGLLLLRLMPADKVASGSIFSRAKPAPALASDASDDDDPYNRPDDR